MTETANAPDTASRHVVPSQLIHQLLTPLNQIIGYSDLMLEKAPDGDTELAPDLLRVRAAGVRLQTLIEENFVRPLGQPVTDPSAVASPRQPPAARPTGLARTTGPRGHFHLLVVDDIEANRDVLARRLEGQGYSVTAVESGRRALDVLTDCPFDLVLLDIMMPEMDGFEVLRLLKADARLRHIPVIMISALSESEAVARCIEMGAEDYLTKPFNPTLLKARVGACLAKKIAHDREMQLLDKVQDSYDRLLRLETSRDDLTHMIIHDLRTPLTSVIAGVQTIEAVGDLNRDQREALAIAVSGGETLVGIINDLLDVVKMESESMPLDRTERSAATLITDAIGQVSPLAEAKGLMLLWDAPIDLRPLFVDDHKLRRVLVNLIGNAIKFTPTGGSVTVGAKMGDDEASILFSVRDSGEGIPADSFGRIFEKFGQVDSRQGGRTNSTGLGLTFCKLAVETHGGQIGVESKPGEGSNFWFTIPLAP